eukprot:6658-Heterococcus_DN1.PRE.5
MTIWHDISACTHINTSTAHKQISITTWLILILCALVSFACLSIDNAIYQNNEPVVPVTDGGTTFYPEPQNHPDIFSVNSVTEFNIAGWLLFLFICGFYMLARRSELRLLRKSGANSTHDYADVLEKDALDPAQNLAHFNPAVAPDLTQLLAHVKSVNEMTDSDEHSSSKPIATTATIGSMPEQQSSRTLLSSSSSKRFSGVFGSSSVHSDAGSAAGSRSGSTALLLSSKLVSQKQQRKDAANALVSQWQQQQQQQQHSVVTANSTSSCCIAEDSTAADPAKSVEKDVGSDTPAAGDSPKLEADVTGVYLFNSPWLFRQTLSQLLMFNNIEIGLLIGNFGWVAGRDTSTSGAQKFGILLALILPIILSFPVLKAIIRIGSVLDAISVLKPDILGSVVEGMEESFGLAQDFSYKLRTRLSTAGLGATELTELVDTLAVDGYIRPSGLRQILTLTGLHMPDRKFKRLFRALGTLLQFTLMQCT